MAYNNEGSKLRSATLAVVTAAVPSLTFPNHAVATTINCYNALSARNKRVAGVTVSPKQELPAVCFATLDGQELVKTLGNKRVPLIVTIESHADCEEALDNDDPEANHNTLVAAVCDTINDDGIAATLIAASADFYVFDVIDMGEMDCEAADGMFRTAHRWDVVCANAALS